MTGVVGGDGCLRKQRQVFQSRGFRRAEHEVHVLDRLPRRSLNKVVERRDRRRFAPSAGPSPDTPA